MDIRRNLPLLMTICFLSQMGGFMILPLFPLFIEEFGLSGWMMGVIFALFYVGKVIGGVPAAVIYKKLGGKRALIFMLVLLAVCMGGFAASSAAVLFGLLRLLQGLASTGLTVVVRSIIGDGGNVDNRGLYNGYISSSEGGGMVLGPVISGWLALHWPLSVPFLLVTLCCLMAVVTAMGMKTTAPARASHESEDTLNDPPLEEPYAVVKQEPLDNSTHSVLHTDEVEEFTTSDSHPHTTMTATPLPSTTSDALHTQGTDISQSDQAPDSTTIGPTTGITQRQQLLGYSTVHFLEMSAYAVFLTYFALYAAHIMHWDPFATSLAFTVSGISTLAAAPFVGYLSDRLGDRLLLCMLGMFLIGIEVVVFLSTSSHLWVYVGMLIGGVGGACYMDSFFAHIGDHIPDESRSSVIGKIVSAAEIGSIVSPLVAALLMEVGSLYSVFVFNLVLIAAAIVVQAAMRSRYRLKQG
ncbi:DHA1 family quinolone resistance protein-like MFS transporter [Paenibacillus sp. W4I10]|uniref:MFS transporter n=1 Tax=Paenibacillus sp. W4I10 TaxID=3042298 RepID=UPI002788137C|nr:MFS transporter [Paenibacillus sp. W4I10]MDQ0723836.1 DHA1 family quinolone resistance protein-like MFS transporter [Paenibacillus sp. W4I10]